MTSEPHPMLVKVAREICRSKNLDPDTCVEGSGNSLGQAVCHVRCWQWYVSDARAALEALLEPDDATVGNAMAAAVTKMAYAGMDVDALECLLTGDGRGTTPPGILRAGMTQFHRAMLTTVLGESA